MKSHSQRTSRFVIALTALCIVWLLSGQIISVPAFAEGSNPPVPVESLPVDTTIIISNTVMPDGDPTTTDVIEVIVLFFSAVL
jgi:hypothetical protein